MKSYFTYNPGSTITFQMSSYSIEINLSNFCAEGSDQNSSPVVIFDRLVSVVPLHGEQEPAQRQVVNAEPWQQAEVDEHSDRGLKLKIINGEYKWSNWPRYVCACFAPPSTPDFLGEVGLNLALVLGVHEHWSP